MTRCGRVIDCLGENLLHLTAHTLTERIFLTGEIEQVAPNWVTILYIFSLRLLAGGVQRLARAQV